MTYSATTYMAKMNPTNPDPLAMALAAQVILEGGLVAFPTETVYGLGANALNPDAVERIFKAKQSESESLVIHIEDLEQLELVATNIPYRAHELVKHLWAGGLTILLKPSHLMPDIVINDEHKVAVRMPAHPVAQLLLHEAGVPIVAPSANLAGRPSATSAVHVMHDLSGHVDVVLNAGKAHIGIESTIVDFTLPTPTLIRAGAISLEELRRYVPSLAYHPEFLPTQPHKANRQIAIFKGNDDALTWEAMRKHAQTAQDNNKRVGVMVCDDDVFQFEGIQAQFVLMGKDEQAMASKLYTAIREFDASEVDMILVRAPEPTGIGLAITDRLERMAGSIIIELAETS